MPECPNAVKRAAFILPRGYRRTYPLLYTVDGVYGDMPLVSIGEDGTPLGLGACWLAGQSPNDLREIGCFFRRRPDK